MRMRMRRTEGHAGECDKERDWQQLWETDTTKARRKASIANENTRERFTLLN